MTKITDDSLSLCVWFLQRMKTGCETERLAAFLRHSLGIFRVSSLSCRPVFFLLAHSCHSCGSWGKHSAQSSWVFLSLRSCFLCRGNEDTPYQVKHAMAYPQSKATAERIALEANGTEVSKCTEFSHKSGLLEAVTLQPIRAEHTHSEYIQLLVFNHTMTFVPQVGV